MQLKIGQIGVGAWGKFHCELLSKMPEANLVGIFHQQVGQYGKRRKKMAINDFRNLDELLSSVEAVVITASTRTHFQIAHQALSHKVSVFVEKPICTSTAEADELIRLANKNNLVLQVGHIERFNPAYRALAGLELKPIFINAQRTATISSRSSDVSVVLDLMIHDIDLILDLVKSPVEQVVATGMSLRSKNLDFANARIRFVGGCVANLTASRIDTRKSRTMQIIDKHSIYELDFIQRSAIGLNVGSNGSDLINLTDGQGSSCTADNSIKQKENMLQSELVAFINSVCVQAPVVVDGLAGRCALDLAEQVENAIRDN